MDISQKVRPQIQEIKTTNWGEIPENSNFRLMFGENPFTLDECIMAIKQEVNKLNTYPSPTKEVLIKKIAKYNKILSENIVVTNGSDDGIELIAKVFINLKDEVIIPIPTFPVYESVSKMMGANIVGISLDKDFKLNTDELVKKVNKSTKIIWIANPNNPTGNILISKDRIEWLLKKVPNIFVVIDECYFELSEITAKDLIKKYNNLIILRSFSKIFGLAGLRLGYIISNPTIVSYCKALQQNNQPFSVNRFALAAGIAVMDNLTKISKIIKEYKETKNYFEKKIRQIKGAEVLLTITTFSLIKLPEQFSALFIKNELIKKRIYIKDCSIYSGLGSRYIYLGIPKKNAQQKIIKELAKIINN